MKHKDEAKGQLVRNVGEMRREITGLKASEAEANRAEEALRESGESFRTLVASVPIGLSIIAEDGTYEYVNPKFVEMFGYTLKDVPTGRKWFEKAYPDPEYRQKVIACWIEDLKGAEVGETRPRTFTVTCRDGSRKEIYFRPAAMSDGRQLVTYEDITGRKRAEEVLQESEEKYRTLIEHSLQGLVVVQGIPPRIVFANQALAEILGYPVEELMSLSPEEVRGTVHPDDQAFVWERFQDRLEGKPVPPRYEYRGIRKDSSVRWLEMFANSIEYRGTPAIQAVIVDITEHKRTEEALEREKRAVQRLAEERELVAKIGRIVSSTLEIDKVYELFAKEVAEAIPSDRIAINILHPERETISTAYIAGHDVPGRRSGDVIPLAGSLTEEVTRKRASVLIQTEGIDEVVVQFPRLLPTFQAGFRSLMAVPLISQDKVIGVLHLRSFKANAYTEADVNLAESIGNQIAGAIASSELYAERKRAEGELKKSEERYRSLVEDINDGYFIIQDGKFAYVNQAFANLSGYTKEGILGKQCSRFFPREYLERLSKDDAQGDRGHVGQDELEISRKGGGDLVLEVRSRVIDYGGRPAIAGICKDITERKRAEMTLREKVKELEKWYRLTVDRELKMIQLKRRIQELESTSKPKGKTQKQGPRKNM